MKPSAAATEPLHMRRDRRQRGYALLIMLVIAVMGSLFAVTSQLEFASRKYARDEGTLKSLALAKEALIGYALTYRDDPAHSTEVFGYLPCPDTTGDGDADPPCGSADQAAVGLFPYKTLGLPDLRDADGNCLWYAVSAPFKNNPKATTTVMNWDTQGQFSIKDVNGNNLATAEDINASPLVTPDNNGGAVAVIFAAGPPLAGQSRSAGGGNPCQISSPPTQVAAYLDGGYNFATGNTIALTQGASGSASNNDQLAWISPKEIFDKIVKRADFSNPLASTPAGQINKLSDELKAVLELKIQNDLAAGTTSLSQPRSTGSYTQFAGKQIGDVRNDLTTAPTTLPSDYSNYYSNWMEQYRQVTCSPLTPCLTINGTACRGALLFGGRSGTVNGLSANSQPRLTTQKSAATANLGYYFESPTVAPIVAGGGLDLLKATTTSFLGNTAYASASPTTDFASCLFSGSFLSFAQDIAGFASGRVTPTGITAVASVDTVAKTVALGNTTGASSTGCVWYPTPIELSSMFRAYFKYMVTDTGTGRRGTGFTMALADASVNNPASTSPLLCGAADRDMIGYAGQPPSGTATRFGTTRYISGVSWSGGTATITTSTSHGWSSGNSVVVSGVTPSGYNGTITISSVPSSTQFRYALATDPGGSAGIKPPKLGVEFDTRRNTAFLDPGSSVDNSHFAFVYWGGAADSGPTGTGVDDNTHYAGILGSGAEPMNPRETGSTPPTATPVALISAASWAGGTVTATALGPHGFVTGNYVDISDIATTSYDGIYAVTATDAAHFTYALAANPGTYVQGTTAIRTVNTSSASYSSGIVTMNTALAHGLAVGDYVSISGINPVGYNGVYQVASVPNTTRITYAQASNPGGYTSGGAVTRTLSIAAASWSSSGGGTVSVTTSAAHGLASGQYVNIANISPSGYDGTYAATVVDSTHFTYALASDPGSAYSASSPAGMATCSGAEVSCSSSAVPFSTWIHVRIDISRAYDTTTKQSTYKLRAYITDSFANCSSTDYANLSRELSSLCSQTPTIGQDGVVISDISTPVNISTASWSSSTALVTVTTSAAHGLASGQSVNVAGVTPTAYNGSRKVTVVNATQFTFPLTTDPTAYSSGGTVAAQALSTAYIGFTTGRGTNTNDNQNVTLSSLLSRSE